MSILSLARTAGMAILLAACTSSTDAGSTSVDLSGAWKYTAVQTSGSRVTYDGTLNVTQQSGATFAGGLDAESRTPQGVVSRVNAVVSGRVVDAAHVTFDMDFTDATRTHVGTIRGDSIVGSWGTSDLTAVGTFTMARVH